MEDAAWPALAADPETDRPGRQAGSRPEVRLWLRLLTCTTMIEGEIRRRLRERFGVTLPRFDLMAQLDKAPGGLTLSDLSKRMMVSNGNLTGLVERLVATGHVDRRASDTDRRAQVVSLTDLGRAEFRIMAKAHEGWLVELFAALSGGGQAELMGLLARAKDSVRAGTRDARK
jgi:DNA-binding MarR family transcriptional regulator